MIEIKVRNFRGCERADLVVSPICLIAGQNGAGKTSIVQAVAAILSGHAIPIRGMAKADAGALVRQGAGSAMADLTSPDGTCHVSWPDGIVSADGEPPSASRIAAGVDSIPDMPMADRARALSALLHADPTRDDLAAALVDVGIGASAATAALWKLVEDQGWDAAHEMRRTKGAEHKGAWRQVTGQQYGSRVAASWTPPDWADDLDGQTERELAAALDAAKRARHDAIAAAAADGARRGIIEDEAGRLTEREGAVAALTDSVGIIQAEIDALTRERDALPPPSDTAPPTIPCPHCGAPIVASKTLIGVELRRPAAGDAPRDPDELKRVRLRRATLDGSISNAETRVTQARAQLGRALAALENSRAAWAELQSLKPGGPTVDVADAEAAATAVSLAERRLAAFRAKSEADAIRDRITANEAVIGILAPDGLRARKLGRALYVFGARLADLCNAADWRVVSIGPDMAVSYGDRPYPLLSASEQYRARVAIQVAAAQVDGSGMVVIDAADILDAQTRNGLFRLLDDAGLPALVAMTLSRREQVPDLAAAEMGRSYWVERGIAEPVATF